MADLAGGKSTSEMGDVGAGGRVRDPRPDCLDYLRWDDRAKYLWITLTSPIQTFC